MADPLPSLTSNPMQPVPPAAPAAASGAATERLYLDDSSLLRFSARVRELRVQGGRTAALLDRSAFYPEGGGQPGDRGLLGAARVIDTQEDAGAVLHLLDPAGETLAAGDEVQGVVDGARRFDHVQQHHGQHLLSAAFERVIQGARTVSFHLGERVCTIDLDCSISKLPWAGLRAAEAAANQSVWADLPIIARDFSAEERASLPLRKEPHKGDRVVLVEGVDASPCGGTHPRRTGEVGCIAVLSAQRWGQGQVRIEFVCGGRAVARLAEQGELLAGAAEALQSAQADLPQAAARAKEAERTQRKAAEQLAAELCAFLAAGLAKAQPEGPVVAELQRPAGFAKGVAAALSAQGRVALVAAIDGGRAQLCFSRPKGPGPALHELLREALSLLGGKGGGSPDHAQGSGEAARVTEALAAARAKAG